MKLTNVSLTLTGVVPGEVPRVLTAGARVLKQHFEADGNKYNNNRNKKKTIVVINSLGTASERFPGGVSCGAELCSAKRPSICLLAANLEYASSFRL